MTNYKKEYGIINIDINYGKNNTVIIITDINYIKYVKLFKEIVNATELIIEEVPLYKSWQIISHGLEN